LNTILWYGIAETEDNYHVAFYSLLDTSNHFSEWQVLPKSRDITVDRFKDLNDLAWFSNDYYNVVKLENGNFLYKDLRYPLIKTRTGYKAVFNLELYQSENRLDMKPFAPDLGDFKFTMHALWVRMKGI
jgi:inner membrane protein